ncbi:uncharacterized protein LOC119599320 isoform X3 [Penaeus monodon]|uniref:uncharacterized protein LOC119599320 isoform X3 n=1 Tax=Penaeus monodon TaxID=6687 RepID=UPI0018A75289|nr:uncharacterized protein LOC119599320 isoform X3 [Penaeus monodon]
MEPPPLPDHEEPKPLNNVRDTEPQSLRELIDDGIEMRRHSNSRSAQNSRSSQRSQSSGSSASSKMSTHNVTQTEHIEVAVDGEPTLNLVVDGKPTLNLAVDGEPTLNLAVDGKPTLNLAVDGEPTLNLERSTFYISCNAEKTSRGKGLSESGESNTSSYGTCKDHSQDELDGVLLDVRTIMSRQRSESLASLEYYRSQDTRLQVSAREELQVRPQGREHDRHVQQSQRLPFWLWFIIAKSLGIKLHADDKPIAATILYTLTFMTALGYIMSNWWFTAYDIASHYTNTTVIDGTISIFYSLLWGALGVYANKLAYRLFSHKKFLDMLRLHSKTILKMNAAAVLFTVMMLFALINDVSAYSNFKDETCQTVAVDVIVCKVRYIMRVVYSGFAVAWNYLVAFVLISVCRTHVIGIRKFMQSLEQDSRVYEARYMGVTQHGTPDRPVLEENGHHSEGNELLSEYTWVDEDYLEELRDPGTSDVDSNSSALIPQQGNRCASVPDSSGSPDSVGLPIPRIPASPSSSGQSVASERSLNVQKDAQGQASSVCSTSTSAEVRTKPTPLMSNSEILFRYWKIQSRLRLSSVALQRWMMSVLSMVVVWLAMNLVLWLNHDPMLIDLANFFLPLALLPLLASAYAEVNQEGLRLLKFICPVEERLQMLYVLQNNPLQMTVYGFTLSYSTITTAAFGILLAFASKVLIQELSGPKTPPIAQ